jgi:hypothetical protein
MKTTHPLARAFCAAHLLPLAELGARLKVYGDDELGLVLGVVALPLEAFNPAALDEADGGPHPLFTRHGETLWANVRDRGARTLRAENAGGDVFVFLMEAAITVGQVELRTRREPRAA